MFTLGFISNWQDVIALQIALVYSILHSKRNPKHIPIVALGYSLLLALGWFLVSEFVSYLAYVVYLVFVIPTVVSLVLLHAKTNLQKQEIEKAKIPIKILIGTSLSIPVIGLVSLTIALVLNSL